MFNIFMKIDDIPGDVRTEGFTNQIGIHSMNHGVSMNAFCQPGKEGRTQGYAHHNDVTLSKVMDGSSYLFKRYCMEAKPIKKATISICREKDSVLLPIIVFTIEDVLVSSYNFSAGGGANPSETLTLNYRTISWTYRDQKQDAKHAGQKAGGWDIRANKEYMVK
ncbi:Hcp family type VI secretion system effector [Acanthopleuribacter pedis]|uniref:Type VI secretion system tube protein Hcp n=1 Tax=Acanthopleuribacter pedis TaxID=442870 RepID=A0A8J7U763_9BACT|nr:type VI secretion system tube protein Hcp [Acanthopleuribacter pedis]MBO1321081.1 type VI secretion system tube protein Hcp [Acanthopleuribacter pedis]